MKPKAFATRLSSQFLNSMFQSIDMALDHKLHPQLFLIGFCLFCS